MAHRAPAGIGEHRVLVVGSQPALPALATGLRRQGLAVATADTMTDYDAAFAAADADIGRIDAAVWALTPASLGRPAPLVSLDEPEWVERVGAPLRSYVEFLQAAERRLRRLGGTIVTVVPTIAMTGAADLVAWATVAEGQRAMAKSVARVWGANAITVNCVAVPAAFLVAAADGIGTGGLQQPALTDPDVENDVAGLVAALCGNGFTGVTGATIGVDGGRWIGS